MERRHWFGLGVAVVVVLGAFVLFLALGGADPGGQERAAYLDVQRVDGPPPADETVAFSALSSGQQVVFEDAIDDEDGYVSIPADVDENVWVEHRYVRYRNVTYHVAVAVP